MKKKLVQCCAGVAMCMVMGLAFNADTASAASDGFQVSGTKLYDANGNEFVMRGVNYPHAWFSSEYKTAIPAIADKGFNCVRIVLADGQKWTKTTYNELKSLISICKENNLIAIFDVHDTTGSDYTSTLNEAVDYWIEMKDLLQGNEEYVIVNIANEWYGTWDDGSAWKNGYVSAISKLRNAGIENTLMVDCAGWGQYPQVIKDYGKDVLAADEDKNTMFSIHMYEYAGGNATTVKTNIDNALNQNLCLAIGEFGGYHSDGDVDEDTIMSYCEEKNVGWAAWSWYGNNSDLGFLDLTYDWAGSRLTEFGERVVNGANGVKETSTMCSVFGGSGSGSGSSSSSQTSYNMFYGSSYADNWDQAVSIDTAKNGGWLNLTTIDSDDYIWVEYKGAYGQLDLVLSSWSGGAEWAKVSPSESGTTSTGSYYAKFKYSDMVKAYGSNFSTVDKLYVSAQQNGITVISVDLVK